AYRHLERTREPATALLDVHAERLMELTDTTRVHASTLGADGERVAASVAALQADVSHLRWLLDRIPEERARLRRMIIDILLPTPGRDEEHDDVRS
ncbi:MAG: hypothetical protein H7287_03600, partial [Thermoleophilia bacterium]|nr:hypothetical protein [Thermoleophilia bacterium]